MQTHALTPSSLESEIQQLLDSGFELPVLPRVASEMLASANEDEYDPQRLATVIQQDQTIAIQILRVANSPMYQGSQKIVALQQAIARLGLDTLREIAIAATLGNAHFKAPHYASLVAEYWEYALKTALWSKEVARATRSNVEAAYLAGLLHNIGSPLVIQALVALKGDSCPTEEVRRVTENLTTSASLRLCDAWDLPPAITTTVGNWDRPAEAAGFETIAASTGLGMLLADGSSQPEFDLRQLSSSPPCAQLGLYPDQLEQLWGLRAQIRESIGILK